MNEVFEFLMACGTFYLATEENGQPRVRPFGAVANYDGALYLVTSNEKQVFEQLQKNPRAELCCFKDGKWLRVACTLTKDDRREAKVFMLDAFPHLRSMYSEDDGKMEVLRMSKAEATFSIFGAAPKTICF